MRRLWLVLALVLLPAWAFAQSTFYVSTTGSDAANGAIGTPWRTVQKAATTLTAGQTALLRGGTFTEHYIQFGHSGTAGNPITIAQMPGEMTIVDGGYTTTGSTDPVFMIDGPDYITLDGFEARRGRTANIYLSFNTSGSTHIVIQNMTLTNFVLGDNAASIYVDVTSADILIANNRIHGYVDGGWGQNVGSGVIVFRHTGDLTVRNNEMYGLKAGIYYKHNDPGSMTTTIQQNYIHDIENHALLWTMHHALIQNNLLVNAGREGIKLFEAAGSCVDIATDHNTFTHNTVVNTESGVYLSVSDGCTGAVNTTVTNDVIEDFGTEYGGVAIWQYADKATDLSATTLRNNLVHDSAIANELHVFLSTAGGTVSYDIAAAPGTVTASGNIGSAPTFTNAAGGDYRLTTGSAGHNGALDGTDMGAYGGGVTCVGVSGSPQCPGGSSGGGGTGVARFRFTLKPPGD